MKKLFSASILLVLLASVAHSSPWRADGPTTVAHRGTTVIADENTMAAYDLAADNGVDVIECDPRPTRDGVLVIMHDETVDRTTDGKGRVADLTLAEVKKLRTKSGQEVPTLAEVLAFARERGIGVYLDMKPSPKDGGELLMKTVAEAGMTDRVIVGCYDLWLAASVHRLAPETSISISWPFPATFGLARLVGAEAVGTLTGLATPAAIRLAHLYGLKMVTLPINDPEKLAKMRAIGIDGLQSDDPRLLKPYGREQ